MTSCCASFPTPWCTPAGALWGFPTGQMGNSEVGHLNIGAGRVVYMDITRLDLMIENGELFKHPLLVQAMTEAQKNGRRLHFIGLLSDGGVHSHENHLYALLRMAKRTAWSALLCMPSSTGAIRRRTPARAIWKSCSRRCASTASAKLPRWAAATMRMDRDKKWERERKAFDAMVRGKAEAGSTTDPVQMVKDSYNRGVYDEFVCRLCAWTRTTSRWRPFATRTWSSTSTSAPTARGRLPRC